LPPRGVNFFKRKVDLQEDMITDYGLAISLGGNPDTFNFFAKQN
jgi:hypothetical protein